MHFTACQKCHFTFWEDAQETSCVWLTRSFCIYYDEIVSKTNKHDFVKSEASLRFLCKWWWNQFFLYSQMTQAESSTADQTQTQNVQTSLVLRWKKKWSDNDVINLKIMNDCTFNLNHFIDHLGQIVVQLHTDHGSTTGCSVLYKDTPLEPGIQPPTFVFVEWSHMDTTSTEFPHLAWCLTTMKPRSHRLWWHLWP